MDATVTSTRRAPGVLLLLSLVGLGMGVPAFFRWQYFAAEANRDRILEEAPTEPCLLYTSPSPRDKRQSRMPSSA